MTTTAHLNAIGTAHPPHDVHAAFVAFARTLLAEPKARSVFDRLAERAGIAQRWSFMAPGDIAAGEIDRDGFYRRDAFPGTAARMALYETEALRLAIAAASDLAADLSGVTHLVVASCTGFTAPGLDLQLLAALGLRSTVERTLIGFMGCSAAVPALRAAQHIVRSQPEARVLVVNVELCTLHLRQTADLEQVLSFLIFGDGAAAALVTAEPHGIALGDFHSALIDDSRELITWRIGDSGFEMHLSGQVPVRIVGALRAEAQRGGADGLLRGERPADIDLWAVHAGGRTVLDAVEAGLGLPPEALADSRAVLLGHGNMSSATVMFVLRRMLERRHVGARGLAMAFGPGMVAESFRFRIAG